MSEQTLEYSGIKASISPNLGIEQSANLIYDCIINNNGMLEKRPVVQTVIPFGGATPPIMESIHYWVPGQRLVGIGSNKSVYLIYSPSNSIIFPYNRRNINTTTLNTVSISGELDNGTQHSFCEYRYAGVERFCFTAYNLVNDFQTGSRIMMYTPAYGNPVTPRSLVTISGSPEYSRSICTQDGYLLTSVADDNKVYWSNLLDPTTWTPTDYVEALEEGDQVNAICSYKNKLYVFGETTIQQFYNAGTEGFVNVQGATINGIGTLFPSTVSVTKYGISFVATNGSIYLINESGIELLSADVEKLWSNSTTSSTDYRLSYASFEGKDYFIFTVPGGVLGSRDSEYSQAPNTKTTFVYDIKNKQWYNWSFWDAWETYVPGMNRNAIRGHIWSFDPVNNLNWGAAITSLYSGVDTGALFTMESNTSTCREVANISGGYTTPSYVNPHMRYDSAYVDWGISNRKQSTKLSLRASRNLAYTDLSTPKTITVGYYDETNTLTSSREVTISTSQTDGMTTSKLYQGGMYESRKYSLHNISEHPLVIDKIKEDITPLGT